MQATGKTAKFLFNIGNEFVIQVYTKVYVHPCVDLDNYKYLMDYQVFLFF